MDSTETEFLSPTFSKSIEEDFLVRKILLTHDPDGRRLHSELLLQAVESVMCSTASAEDSDLHNDGSIVSKIEVVGSEETLEHIVYKISREMMLKCSVDGDLHIKTMVLFDMLGDYTWDAKVVLILAALATSYGECWLIMQMYPHNPLAASVALLKQFPSDLSVLRIRLKALTLLINTMVELTKCIIKFEGLLQKDILLDYRAMALAKSQIYIATYWIFRSSLECSSQITDFITMKHEKYSHSTTIAAWGLSNLVHRLRSLCSDLRKQVDFCHQQIEAKLYNKLLNLFKEVHEDNQEVIHMLFGLKDDMPLKNCSSQAQVNISELRNKVVIILVSKPELLPNEQIHLLVQQTYDHPYKKKVGTSYEIVWFPIPSSDTWSFSEKRSFSFLSNSLPWLSIQKPWLLSSAVVSFIKQEWNYKEQQPLMVVLDSQGRITNTNAIDMVFIRGAEAFPFSTSREKELWEEEN